MSHAVKMVYKWYHLPTGKWGKQYIYVIYRTKCLDLLIEWNRQGNNYLYMPMSTENVTINPEEIEFFPRVYDYTD